MEAFDLLPNIDELKEVDNCKNTFYECGFNKPFNELSDLKKIQIVCDIVRQTIYPNVIPNPDSDIEELNGNCYTASAVLKKYLLDNNLVRDAKIVLGRKRIFDPDDITTVHSLLLVTGNDNNTYQVDPTPFVGYGYGKVINIKDDRLYEEYVFMDDQLINMTNNLKRIIYLDSINQIDRNRIKYYLNICYEYKEFSILNSFIANALIVLAKYMDSDYDKQIILRQALKLKPYSKINVSKRNYQEQLLKKEIDQWFCELEDLKNSDSDIKKQQELSSNIVQQMKFFDESYEKYAFINGRKIRLSFINPRFLYENNLNVVMVKPSAYYIKRDDYIKNLFIAKFGNVCGEYYVNLAQQTKQCAVKPMLFSHPCGEEYIRSMDGTANIILFNESADNLNDLKQQIRKKECEDMWYKKVIWTDGKEILWHPFVTNLVHAADNYSESALHFLIGYPEHQAMTRFMTPNYKLKGL